MIRIKQGTYGFRKGNSIVPKTSKDEPFSINKVEEARLVKLGVAEYVVEAEAEAETVMEETEDVAETNLQDATLAELKEITKGKGATTEELKPIRTKAQAIALIEKLTVEETEEAEEEAEAETVVEETEDAPDLSSDDGVVE